MTEYEYFPEGYQPKGELFQLFDYKQSGVRVLWERMGGKCVDSDEKWQAFQAELSQTAAQSPEMAKFLEGLGSQNLLAKFQSFKNIEPSTKINFVIPNSD